MSHGKAVQLKLGAAGSAAAETEPCRAITRPAPLPGTDRAFNCCTRACSALRAEWRACGTLAFRGLPRAMDADVELTPQDSAFIQTASQASCGALEVLAQRRGPLPSTTSLASSMAAASEEEALVVSGGTGGACSCQRQFGGASCRRRRDSFDHPCRLQPAPASCHASVGWLPARPSAPPARQPASSPSADPAPYVPQPAVVTGGS